MDKIRHLPEGVRDLFGAACEEKQVLEQQIAQLLRSYGYSFVETPSFEFLEVFGEQVGTAPVKDLYKLFDREGRILALRPDFTPSIARMVSSQYADASLPLRLCYRGSVFLQEPLLQGRLCEKTQMGAEYLLDNSPEADAEILALVAALLQKAGLREFQISVGSVPFFEALVKEAGLKPDAEAELRSLLAAQNRYGAIAFVERLSLPAKLSESFCRLPELFGDESVLGEAERIAIGPDARAAIHRLRRIYDLLRSYGLASYITFDLGMVAAYHYYTGIVFRAYSYGSGDALVRGGRYDDLLAHFGKQAAAIGFVTQIDTLVAALERNGIRLPVSRQKTMLLYPAELEEVAIGFALGEREKGLDIACIRIAPGRTPEDYKDYGRRNQFGGILHLQSPEAVRAIDLTTGQEVLFDPGLSGKGEQPCAR